jgi:hypothetical protein
MSTDKSMNRDDERIGQQGQQAQTSRLRDNLCNAASMSLVIRGGRQFLRTTLLTLLALTVFTTLGLAADVNSTKASLSPQETSQLIQRLNAAKKADWDAALDPNISSVREETFLNQMNKADRASKELSNGFPVSQDKIDDALWTPPKHISAEERTRLIEELELARQQDDQHEQNMLNDLAWTRSAAPADTIVFDQRKQQVDTVVKDLEIGAPVHWSAIKQALVVPPSPY